jgi:sRNA-binding regulator protein Hfq
MVTFHCPICNLKTFSEKEEKEHAKTHLNTKPPIIGKPEAQAIKKDVKIQEVKTELKYLDLSKRFLNQDVSILLFNGSMVSGKLTRFSNYDIMLDEKILIPKHALLTMQAANTVI